MKLEFNDVLQLQELLQRRLDKNFRPGKLSRSLYLLGWVMSVFALAALFKMQAVQEPFLGLQTGLHVLAALVAAAGVCIGAWVCRQQEKATQAFDSEHPYFHETTVHFLPAGLEVLSGKSRALVAWDDIHGVEETKDLLVVLTSSTTAVPLPKRAFASDAVSSEALGALRQILGGRAHG